MPDCWKLCDFFDCHSRNLKYTVLWTCLCFLHQYIFVPSRFIILTFEKSLQKRMLRINETGQEDEFLFHGNFNINGLVKIEKKKKKSSLVLENHLLTCFLCSFYLIVSVALKQDILVAIKYFPILM